MRLYVLALGRHVRDGAVPPPTHRTSRGRAHDHRNPPDSSPFSLRTWYGHALLTAPSRSGRNAGAGRRAARCGNGTNTSSRSG